MLRLPFLQSPVPHLCDADRHLCRRTLMRGLRRAAEPELGVAFDLAWAFVVAVASCWCSCSVSLAVVKTISDCRWLLEMVDYFISFPVRLSWSEILAHSRPGDEREREGEGEPRGRMAMAIVHRSAVAAHRGVARWWTSLEKEMRSGNGERWTIALVHGSRAQKSSCCFYCGM